MDLRRGVVRAGYAILPTASKSARRMACLAAIRTRHAAPSLQIPLQLSPSPPRIPCLPPTTFFAQPMQQHVTPPPDTAKGKRKASDASDTSTDDSSGWCLICHSDVVDRTVLPRCLHSQFCFLCITRWCAIKPRCPLCQSDVGEYIIHAIRDDADYVRYHLPPSLPSASMSQGEVVRRRHIVSQMQRARASRSHFEASALERRKHIYRYGLYARHVGSNRHTSYRATPTPAQIKHDAATGGVVARRIASFVRRELQVWPHVDGEFLTRYLGSLLQVFGVSSDEAVRLLGEFLGERTARHLLHELECFLRSGKTELANYDASPWLQYPPPKNSVPAGRSEGTDGGEVREEVARRRQVLLDRLERERALLTQNHESRQGSQLDQ
ncbi:uncharacterized protein PAN0_008c3412 [Moesziomyces antarcticus]|uniref:RING-type E3 ubiquitin transferase n=2 Tax=Pseudozyma antarctica TaxID=84753 RepID=A0A081CEU9_PSEA2|nr:uncharacterized protein PAN0_008c3412 [Moesziomyces antarcticus]GAK65195.1 conserved hypothetical protein [Moesziomyces antarcticus]